MESVHERLINCHISKAAFLIDSFAEKNSPLWPSLHWPRDFFDRPLSIGAIGSHGGTRYQVESYEKGHSVLFRFIHPKSYDGIHRFDLVEICPESTLIRHTVQIKARWIDRIVWRVFIKWVHDALIEDAFDSAEAALVGSVSKSSQWPLRVYLYRHLLGATRIVVDTFKALVGKQVQSNKSTLNNLAINPMCNAIIGFQNHTTHATRSRYISFSVEKQPVIPKLLLDIALKRLRPELLDTLPPRIFQQCVDYGLFEPIESKSRSKGIVCYLLNRNRHTKIVYQHKQYRITSFIFMAFNNQKPMKFLCETVILPSWSKKFADVVYQLLSNQTDPSRQLDSCSNAILKRLIKHGVLIHKQDYPDISTFFVRECALSQDLCEWIPPSCLETLAVFTNEKSLALNKQFYFLDDCPKEWHQEFYDFNWIQQIEPSIVVKDPVTQVVSIHWLDEYQRQLLKRLKNGEISLHTLPHDIIDLWAKIHLVETQHSLEARHAVWITKIAHAKEQIKTKNSMVVEDILQPLDLAITRKYIQHLLKKRYLLLDKANRGTKKRYWQHRDNWTFYIHQQMQVVLNQILPEKVKVGHNAITVYQPGAVLPRHEDDVLAFSWVMSLSIDTTPVKDRKEAWPLYVETSVIPKTNETALLGMGDAGVINPQMPHWRDKLTGHSLSIMFLWFVPESYRGFVNGNWIE